jgi:hypothetical protein
VYRSSVLERLDTLDWKSLSHAYGPATDVPNQVRALASPDPEVRSRAVRQLGSNVFHQGSRYEASAFVVPFLYELLGADEVENKEDIIHLLVHIATGYPEAYLPKGPNMEGLRDYIASGLAEAALEWILCAYDAALGGVDRLQRLAAEPRDEVRLAATYALAWFRERAADSAPIVRASVGCETDPTLLSNAVLALGLLDGYLAAVDDVPAFERALEHANPTVRTAASIALGAVAGDRMPAEALRLLVSAVKEVQIERGAPSRLAWNNGDLSGYAGQVLRALGGRSLDLVVPAVIAELEGAAGLPAMNLASVLLGLVFADQPRDRERRSADLLHHQRRVLEALARNENAWRLGGHPSASFALSMRDLGLPGTVSELSSFLER